MGYLIVGLGNIGLEYENTRHNMGFIVSDAFAKASDTYFISGRYGHIAETFIRREKIYILKPSTYMNLSGNAVRYWMQKNKIDVSKLLIVCDDLALPFGTLRMRKKGSDGGHNGLKNINECIGTTEYARLRIGIGDGFTKGGQVDYVLSAFDTKEQNLMPEVTDRAIEAIKLFITSGPDSAMTHCNRAI